LKKLTDLPPHGSAFLRPSTANCNTFYTFLLFLLASLLLLASPLPRRCCVFSACRFGAPAIAKVFADSGFLSFAFVIAV
jgi:hypothetical protein